MRIDVIKLAVLGAVEACSASHGTGLSCGTGTSQLGDECVPVDAAIDAASPVDAPADAAVHGGEAIGYAIDPAHDNNQPSNTIQSPLAQAWSATLTGHVTYPLVVGGMVIVSAGESVSALDAATRARVWGPVAFSKAVMLAYDLGQVFALDQSGTLTALDATTGHQNWTQPATSIAFYDSPPVASGGLIYINADYTYAFDEGSGGIAWLDNLGEDLEGCAAVGNGLVYEAAGCNLVAAWDAQTGSAQWYHSGNCTGGSSETPATYNGMVWDQDVISGSLILSGSGALVNTFASDTLPALTSDTAFYNSKGIVSAVDLATDTIRWSFTGDGEICTAPVVAGSGGQIVVGSQTGNVYELDAATGMQRSVANVGTSLTCASATDSIAVGENHLVVPVGNGVVVF